MSLAGWCRALEPPRAIAPSPADVRGGASGRRSLARFGSWLLTLHLPGALRVAVIAAIVAAAAGGGRAEAHPLDLGYLRIDTTADGTVHVALDLEAGVAARTIGAASPSDAIGRAGELAAVTYRAGALETELGACAWTSPPAAALVAATATLAQTATARCPAGARTLHFALPFLRTQSPAFQILAKTRGAIGEHVASITATSATATTAMGTASATSAAATTSPTAKPPAATTTATTSSAGRVPALDVEAPAPPLGFGGAVAAGLRHVGASPAAWRGGLPEGIDQVLFLLALVLAGGALLELAGIALAFALGCTVALALAASGVVAAPPAVIDALVALTIAAAAVEALTRRLVRRRRQLALAFGLVHGLALAAALGGEAGPAAVAGFDLGVTLGEVAIVAVVVLGVVGLHARRPFAARIVANGGAALILLAGVCWFVARLV